MGLFSHRVNEAGDHIYTWRRKPSPTLIMSCHVNAVSSSACVLMERVFVKLLGFNFLLLLFPSIETNNNGLLWRRRMRKGKRSRRRV
ncbi:hypothetical protein Pfo_009997 [Paulownia fortunei]|nr:hypothetical protein Pfo_009997 [Paulownia fortunei]